MVTRRPRYRGRGCGRDPRRRAHGGGRGSFHRSARADARVRDYGTDRRLDASESCRCHERAVSGVPRRSPIIDCRDLLAHRGPGLHRTDRIARLTQEPG